MDYANVAPFINKTFYVTGMYGVQRPDHMHVGIDLSTGAYDNLFSIFDGKVINKAYSNVRGFYIVVKGDNNLAFLYQHMKEASPLSIGDRVVQGEFLGIEGNSGSSSGIHLHMEMQDLTNRSWNYSNDISYYMNPADYMGIPNQTNAECYYDGTPYFPSHNVNKWMKYLKRHKRIILG